MQQGTMLEIMESLHTICVCVCVCVFVYMYITVISNMGPHSIEKACYELVYLYKYRFEPTRYLGVESSAQEIRP